MLKSGDGFQSQNYLYFLQLLVTPFLFFGSEKLISERVLLLPLLFYTVGVLLGTKQ